MTKAHNTCPRAEARSEKIIGIKSINDQTCPRAEARSEKIIGIKSINDQTCPRAEARSEKIVPIKSLYERSPLCRSRCVLRVRHTRTTCIVPCACAAAAVSASTAKDDCACVSEGGLRKQLWHIRVFVVLAYFPTKASGVGCVRPMVL